MRLYEHDKEDGVPAGPAHEGTPYYNGIKPLA